MKNPLQSVRISTKLLLISLMFTLPMGFMLYYMVGNITSTIQFAAKELIGNKFQRPLEDLLDAVGRHQLVAQRVAGGEASLSSQLTQVQGQVDRAFEALEAADAQHGVELQFTVEGLAKRQRDSAKPSLVKRKWQDLKAHVSTLSAVESAKQHASLVADIRTMIVHAGEMSNLILDPDLDSYYLMDVTLTKLPQMQQRIADVVAVGESVLKRKTNTTDERIQFAILAAQLQDDLDGIRSSSQTVFNEDANFYGVSPTLNLQLKPPLRDLGSSTESFLALVAKMGAAEGELPDRDAFLLAGAKAREASFTLWRAGVTELDVLLGMRIAHYEKLRATQVFIVVALLAVALLFVRVIARNITQPIDKAVRLVESVSNRDLTVRIDTTSRDEIGQICQALNIMVEQLRRSLQSIGLSAQSVSSASQELSAVSTEVSANSEETAAQGRTVSEAATQVSRNIQTVAAATEEMTASIGEIARNASQASKVATHAVTVAERANATVTKLGDSSGEIGNVIKVITGIADQTNLLALNAAIEAARAGELGKGFAVVANEVKELARQTAKATEEIAGKVTAIQGDTQSAVTAIKEIAAIIKEINDIQTVIAG
ncbi:MAG: methyl-accepting chemotaxis protein, partial [Verrucomicrobia bacterium]|nr:methyl-accepting chemotaxis protein [Verrucomicrobiota bacterium]